MTWEDVARQHEMLPKTVDFDFWKKYLTSRPDVLYRLLGDLHQASAQHRGQDPSRVPTVEELRQLVTQEYSQEPFGDALKKALGGRSVRWLAGRLKIHHNQITRLMRGERDVVVVNDPKGSMMRIEAIARELRIHPSYFAEWRRLWLMTLLDSVFEEKPNLSIGIWKKFSEPAQ